MKITTNYLDLLKPKLSERDLEIIHTVGRFKLATGNHLDRLYFAHCSEKSKARNRQATLRRLVESNVLTQVGSRRVGGSTRGSATYLYALDIAGQHVAGLASTRPRKPYSWYEPTIHHFLAVLDLYVWLVEAERSGAMTLLKFEAEPYCWRSYEGKTLKPDAFVQVGIERDGRRRRGSFFIEIDRAGQFGTKISTKIPQYLDYWHVDRSQGAFPSILFLAPHAQRVDYLTRLVADTPGAGGLFRAALMDEAVRIISGS